MFLRLREGRKSLGMAVKPLSKTFRISLSLSFPLILSLGLPLFFSLCLQSREIR
jgi:hypothetical protein